MTDIAWDGKVLAADSRSSTENLMHLTNCRKIFKLSNGAILGTAGDDDDRDVRVVLSKATPRKMPTRQQLADTKTEFSGLMVFPKGHLFMISIGWTEHGQDGEWTASVSPISDRIAAVGHGMEYAYGVMEHGGSAREAVRVACKRDLSCALPVQWATFEIEPQVDAPPPPAPVVPEKSPRKPLKSRKLPRR